MRLVHREDSVISRHPEAVLIIYYYVWKSISRFAASPSEQAAAAYFAANVANIPRKAKANADFFLTLPL